MKINVFSKIFMLFFKLKTWCLDSKIVGGAGGAGGAGGIECIKHEKKVLN
jgi:hypothetical protein